MKPLKVNRICIVSEYTIDVDVRDPEPPKVYRWEAVEDTGMDGKHQILFTSHKSWKTKKACTKNAIAMSKALAKPVIVEDHSLKGGYPGGKFIKFTPRKKS